MATAISAISLAALLAAVTVTDLRTRLIPNRLLAAGALLGLAVALASEPGAVPGRIGWAAGAAGFLGAAHLARPEGMGMGDVKLAGVAGLYLGEAVSTALLVALGAGACAGAALVVRHGAAARARTLPFAPFIAIGAAVACLPLSTVGGWS
jgi:leader peptidase (prepilin peptidase)/N-methyltransferase